MPRYTDEQAQGLKRVIKRSLFEEPIMRFSDGEGNLKYWFLTHIAGLQAYEFTPKDGLDKRAVQWLNLMCKYGWSRSELARAEETNENSIETAVDRLIYSIIDRIPFGLAVGVIKIQAEWKLKGCERCQGDMYRVKDGHLQGRHSWVCLQCGNEIKITHETT